MGCEGGSVVFKRRGRIGRGCSFISRRGGEDYLLFFSGIGGGWGSGIALGWILV